MKMHLVVLVSVAAGAMAGAAVVQALHAQAKPPAFVVGEIDVKNAEMLDKVVGSRRLQGSQGGGDKYATFRIYVVEGLRP
jgi:hypothetical protein